MRRQGFADGLVGGVGDGSGTKGARRWLLPLLCLGVLGASGCPRQAPKGPGRKQGTGQKAVSGEVKVCSVKIREVMARARQCKRFREVWAAVKAQKKKLQDELNLLVTAYRRTYELDLKAAKYLERLEKLKKEKGAILSDAQFKAKLAEMQKELDADPKLAQAVKEQAEESPAYKARKAAAKREAQIISKKGKELQAQLQRKAKELAIPVTKAIQKAVGKALGHQLNGECHVLCDPGTKKMVGHRRGAKEVAKKCAQPDSGRHDATPAVIRDVKKALRAADDKKTPREGSPR